MIDLKKDIVYKAETWPQTLCIDPMLFIKVDGHGAPASDIFQEAIQIIYGIVYTLKFWDKQHKPPAGYEKFSTTPLEGIWWGGEGNAFSVSKPEDWNWTLAMRVPEFVADKFFQGVVEELTKKKSSDIYKKARLETMHEGLSVQMLHIGPYADENKTVNKIREFADENNYELYGRHHEIYMNDPRRVSPDKIKTIIRYPIKKMGKELTLNIDQIKKSN